MSAIDKFLFTAGMEGFNDPSSIPSVGIVVPFFGVEEFAEADAEQAQRMTEMNQQANAIYKLQETLVYIDAHRPNFDRSNAEHVVQALGDVQVLLPNMEDPVTIMGSLEHYTPAYTSHLLGHGLEGIGSQIMAIIKKVIELLKKGWDFLNKAIQAKGVIFGKQKRELDELGDWFKEQRKNGTAAPAKSNGDAKVISITAPTYLYTVDSNKPLSSDRLISEVRKYTGFIRAFHRDFITRQIMLGDLIIRAINSADIASTPNDQLFVKVFKGQFSFNGVGGTTLYSKRDGDQVDLAMVGLIGGIGFKAKLNSALVSPVEMTPDGSNQRKFFKQMQFLHNYSFTSKINMDGSSTGGAPIYACNVNDAENLTHELSTLAAAINVVPYDTDVRDFNKRVTDCVTKLGNMADTMSHDRSDFITTMINALSGLSSGLEQLTRGMNQQSNTLLNNVREYVTKSVKE
ncbi:internal head protein [Erwinia phage AH06]|nr:internal head protein [Erwinia phage AH06]